MLALNRPDVGGDSGGPLQATAVGVAHGKRYGMKATGAADKRNARFTKNLKELLGR